MVAGSGTPRANEMGGVMFTMRTRNRGLLLGLLLCVLVMATPLLAQRGGGSRQFKQLEQRLKTSLEKQLAEAIALLPDQAVKFQQQHCAEEQDWAVIKAPDAKQVAAWKQALQLIQAGPLMLNETLNGAVSVVKLTEEQQAALQPAFVPPPEPEKPEQPVPTAGYGDQLSTAVEKALKDLQAGEYKTFLERISPPTELARMLQEKLLEHEVNRLKNDAKQRLLLERDFELMQQKSATLVEEDGRKFAVYSLEYPEDQELQIGVRLKQGIPPLRACVLQLQGGHWRFMDGNAELAERLENFRGQPQTGSQLELIWKKTTDGWRIESVSLQ